MSTPIVTAKESCLFSHIAPAGFCILAAIQHASHTLKLNMRVTSACDGTHSGPDDPHHKGEAFDLGSHEFNAEQKQLILTTIMGELGWERFYGFLEAAGTENEHFHFQRKKGTTYP